jgi:GntR family transcriptional repressor for pyruvate dehydrogenase complex
MADEDYAGLAIASDAGAELHRMQKRSERVALEIVHDIVARRLRTGDRLPLEAAMVENYRVSRASLREALRLLEVQGLIRLKPGPGGGPVVGKVDAAHLARTATLYLHLSAANYRHLLDAQVRLEPLCASLAAAHPDRKAAMQPYLEVPEFESEQDYFAQTKQFHVAVYGLAANPVLTLLTHAVTHIVADQVVATMDPVELRGPIVHEHTAIARAIANGHATKAATLMGEHFALQRDYYEEHWPRRLDEFVAWR